MSKMGLREPFYVAKSFLTYGSGLSDKDLQALKVIETENGIDVFDVIEKIAKKWKKINSMFSSDDLDVVQLDMDIKREKLLTVRTKNQLLLMDLMPKVEAKARVMDFLVGMTELNKLFFKEMANKFKGETRENEIWLTSKWNEILQKFIDEKADIISWTEDGKTNLLETRILKKETENSVFEYIEKVKEVYDAEKI